ncbi:MAG: SOS response-associated peptidase family protein [Bacillota bacterium]|nr:SOS response-associated peptidase family protein [Bacillota bacterium]
MDRKYPGRFKTGELFPGDTVPGIIAWNDKIVPIPATFGFPGFQGKKLLINARSETAAEKLSFADSLRGRRIVLPATSFYEWSHDTRKQKYQFTVKNSSALYLCGIYKIIDSEVRFVILTREANESMIEIHHRMPVILSEREVRSYLSDYPTAMEFIGSTPPVLERRAV